MALIRTAVGSRTTTLGRCTRVAAAVALVGLCSPSRALPQAAPSIRAATRVTNGVIEQEHGSDALRRAHQLSPAATPDAILGGNDVDPSFDLTYLSTAIQLQDGRVATFSRIGSKLVVFSANGREQRLIGRQGQGPGEFMRASVLIGVADSLILVDVANRRINWILADRGVVAERSLALSFDRSLETTVGYLAPGRIVMTGAGRVRPGEPDRIVRPLAAIGVVSARDGTSRIVASVPDLDIAMFETRFRGRPRLSPMPLRLGRRAIITVWDTLIAVAGGSEGAVELMSPDGRIIRRLLVPARRQPVTSQIRQAIIDRELLRFTGPQSEGLVDRAESERIAREAPFADSLPTIGDLLVGTDGILWLVDGRAPSDAVWAATGVALDGSIVARAQGTGGTPVAFGAGRVVLRREDGDGVVSLAVHRLVERPRQVSPSISRRLTPNWLCRRSGTRGARNLTGAP